MSPLHRRAFSYVKRMINGEHIDWETGKWIRLPAGSSLNK